MPGESFLAIGTTRRELLRFLFASPLFPLMAASDADAEGENQELIATASDAINVFDFRPVAEHKLAPAHYTYLSMGVEHEITLNANREAFAKIALRPRRLVDVRHLDTGREILGTKLSSPLVLAPVGSQRMYHPEAELAVARAARRKDHLQILSMGASVPLEDVVEARQGSIWYQLYAQRIWPVTRQVLKRAEAAGCPAIVLTVDIVGLPTNRERIDRFRRAENPECQSCHASAGQWLLQGAERIAGAIGVDARAMIARSMMLDWELVDRIRDATPLKLIIKGILTAEDAHLCVEHGIDGIIVSNHGGRAEDSGLATIEILPEIVGAVSERIPILVDSGFRRGTDVFKALALGASAVCVGRPYLWGLAAFGEVGVEAVLTILRRELETIMRQMGTPTLGAITPAFVQSSAAVEAE
ncbi:MAG TPA: alpha-hydroxy acid oxidase [Myxococcota bacterium]|nr:alpha-hydroxy acid oxidase [Myxococcota bacterium]